MRLDAGECCWSVGACCRSDGGVLLECWRKRLAAVGVSANAVGCWRMLLDVVGLMADAVGGLAHAVGGLADAVGVMADAVGVSANAGGWGWSVSECFWMLANAVGCGWIDGECCWMLLEGWRMRMADDGLTHAAFHSGWQAPSPGILPVGPSGTGILPVGPSGTGILPVGQSKQASCLWSNQYKKTARHSAIAGQFPLSNFDGYAGFADRSCRNRVIQSVSVNAIGANISINPTARSPDRWPETGPVSRTTRFTRRPNASDPIRNDLDPNTCRPFLPVGCGYRSHQWMLLAAAVSQRSQLRACSDRADGDCRGSQNRGGRGCCQF